MMNNYKYNYVHANDHLYYSLANSNNTCVINEWITVNGEGDNLGSLVVVEISSVMLLFQSLYVNREFLW